MSYDSNNPECFELLDAVLRREVPPEEPLSSELQGRIVASIRAESLGRGRVLTFRRYAIGVAVLAAGVLLTITLLVVSRPAVNSPGPVVKEPGVDIFEKIPPAPVIVDNSLAAVEEFAADSVVREMQYLVRDASDIGSAMFASLPVDVGRGGQSQWWTKLLDK